MPNLSIKLGGKPSRGLFGHQSSTSGLRIHDHSVKSMPMKRFIAILVLLFTIVGCGGDVHASYIGLWKTSDPLPKVLEIAKDGDAYLLTDLRATEMSGEKQAPRVLSKAGTQLSINTGIGSAPLALSADKNTLYFDKWMFTRIPEKDASKVKQEIQAERQHIQTNRKLCEALGHELEAKSNDISRSNATAGAKLAGTAELKREIVSRAERIPDCKRMLMLY